MSQFLIAFFFTMGVVFATFSLGSSIVWMLEKWDAASKRKLANEKRLLTLLESIDQKLNTKP